MIFQALAEKQARIIEEMGVFCRQLLDELSQYKNCDDEEKRLEELEGVTIERNNP